MRSWCAVLFWEWLQNVWAVAGVLLGAHAWRGGTVWSAASLGVAGALATALVIRWSEGRKQSVAREPWRLTLANALGFSLGALLLVWYLSLGTPWICGVDTLAGVGLGLVLARMQEQAARGSPAFSNRRSMLRHRLAFVLSFPGTFILMRLAARLALPWVLLSIFPISVLLSAVIAACDYTGAPGGTPARPRAE